MFRSNLPGTRRMIFIGDLIANVIRTNSNVSDNVNDGPGTSTGLYQNIRINPDPNLNVSVNANGNADHREAKYGGKIILPPKALQRTVSWIKTPMIFRLYNRKYNNEVFIGVLTFDAADNEVRVPLWALKQLGISEGEMIQVNYVASALSMGTFAKFQPQSEKFHEITNPKAVLERCLRNYACLSRNDTIGIFYNRSEYELRVCETSPDATITIVDCDLQVDFVAPPNQPQEEVLPSDIDLDKIQSERTENVEESNHFPGVGHRLDGKEKEKSDDDAPSDVKRKKKHRIGSPDFDWNLGTLKFKRHKKDIIPKASESVSRNSAGNIPLPSGINRKRKRSVASPNSTRPVTRSMTAMLRNQINSNGNDNDNEKMDTST